MTTGVREVACRGDRGGVFRLFAMACGGGSPAPANQADGAARAQDRDDRQGSTNPVFLSARTGAEAAAKELTAKHNVPVEIAWLTPPSEDGQVQAQRIAQAVNEGANAILVSCSDAGKVTGAINDAVARGVDGHDLRQRRAALASASRSMASTTSRPASR